MKFGCEFHSAQVSGVYNYMNIFTPLLLPFSHWGLSAVLILTSVELVLARVTYGLRDRRVIMFFRQAAPKGQEGVTRSY